ncbi:MAG: hypothetical protein KAK00_07190 [Nanoarchaeota archaeon]|nr:hypothetical protein [Nanoarchaeota archaeon]
MEKFQELRMGAKKKIGIADHILTQTYPLVQDSKLLLAVIENVFLALTNSMGSILYYERLFKRIPPFQDTFDSKFNMFQARIVDRNKIDRKHIDMIREVKDIIIQHRKSPIEFRRKDKFIICNEDYKMRTISFNDIKEYIKRTKEFINISESITIKNEEIFNK